VVDAGLLDTGVESNFGKAILSKLESTCGVEMGAGKTLNTHSRF